MNIRKIRITCMSDPSPHSYGCLGRGLSKTEDSWNSKQITVQTGVVAGVMTVGVAELGKQQCPGVGSCCGECGNSSPFEVCVYVSCFSHVLYVLCFLWSSCLEDPFLLFQTPAQTPGRVSAGPISGARAADGDSPAPPVALNVQRCTRLPSPALTPRAHTLPARSSHAGSHGATTTSAGFCFSLCLECSPHSDFFSPVHPSRWASLEAQ